MVRFPRYNLMRKVADHRVPFDKDLIVNRSPFTPGYFKAMKEFYTGLMMGDFQVYGSMFLLGLGSILLLGKAYFAYKENRNNPDSRWSGRSQGLGHYYWVEGQLSGRKQAFDTIRGCIVDQKAKMRDLPLPEGYQELTQ